MSSTATRTEAVGAEFCGRLLRHGAVLLPVGIPDHELPAEGTWHRGLSHPALLPHPAARVACSDRRTLDGARAAVLLSAELPLLCESAAVPPHNRNRSFLVTRGGDAVLLRDRHSLCSIREIGAMGHSGLRSGSHGAEGR